MDSFLNKILPIIFIPLVVLNFAGGILSGIWLAIIGEWWAIGYGILGLLISHFIIGIAFIPGFIFSLPGTYLIEKDYITSGFIFVLLSNIYNVIVISVWCIFVFYFFMSKASDTSWLPLMIWSYGVATGPINYLAQQEQRGDLDSPASLVASIFAQFGYIAIMLTAIFLDSNRSVLLIVFGSVMLIGTVFQCIFSIAAYKEAKMLGYFD